MSLEVLTMGRVSADIYPQQVGVPLDEVTTFGRYLGGSPTNVAVAAARHGRRSAVITKTGADPFGRFVHTALRGYGVDDRYVSTDPVWPTPVTFCEIFPPDDFPLYFYRTPTAPDLQLIEDDLDLDAIAAADVFWVTVTGLCQEPSRSTTLAALAHRARHLARRGSEDGAPGGGRQGVEHRGARGATVLDLDYRPMFWDSQDEAVRQIARALPFVTVAVGNREECAVALGSTEPLPPLRTAEALRARGVDLAIVKQGPDGVLAYDGRETVEVPPVPVDVVNGLGAGDAFGGALCHGLLAGWPTERTLRFANAAGAYVAGQLACSDAMPTTAEVEQLLGVKAHG
ncbi:5-dehydro-2-deoxygluconokinase [Nocardioides sp. KR10-350]|uniref:5-dehydro-2-deoxygluconokinase n=1 Tax=Nocardioides cheoyonin TaxID=3156615 RepID=UPI0032B3969A